MSKRLVSLSLILKHRDQRSKQRRKSVTRRLSRTLLALAGALALLLVGAVVGFGFLYARLTHGLPSLETLPILLDPHNGQLLQPTRFYDRTGTHLLFTLGGADAPRRFLAIDPTQPDAFSPYLVQAVIAALQPDYWSSTAYDLAGLTDPQPHTIAERLTRSLLLWSEPDGTPQALRMRLLSAQCMRTYGKTQVLEWYLNSAFFGHYAFGAEAAAQLYLGKSAGELSLAEAAFLVGVLQAPALNPLDIGSDPHTMASPVLEAMLSQGLISQEDFESASRSPITLRQASDEAEPPAYVDLILSELETSFPQERLERGGCLVITSLDYDLQQQTECALQAQLARLQIRSYDTRLPDGSSCTAGSLLPTFTGLQAPLPDDLSASAVILDPANGELLALAGDTQLGSSGGSLHAHEPGSLLTPFIATTAFARGLSPATLVWDAPERIPSAVQSYFEDDPSFAGPMRLRVAFVRDIMNPMAQLLAQLGAQDVFHSMAAFGLGELPASLEPLSTLFEGDALSPLVLARAYSAFATEGSITGIEIPTSSTPSLRAVAAIKDTAGNTIWQPPAPVSVQVVSAPLAFMVHDMLADRAFRNRSGNSGDPFDIGRPAGAKYGVVADGSQVWAVGYTPQRLALVWLGLPGRETRLQPQMAGGIWHALMAYAERDLTPLGWNAPAGITQVKVCDPSGLLPTTLCPSVMEELFVTGNEPIAYDNLYQEIEINRETGRLATVFTPINLIEQRVYLVVPEDVRAWAESAGLPIPPQQYDLIQVPRPGPFVQIASPAIFSYAGGTITIVGTAAGDDFLGYRVEVGQGINPATWELVGEGDQPVSNGMLAQWDTSALNGLYAIRLEVLRSRQYFDVAIIQVTIDNTPPTVEIDYPQEGRQLAVGQDVIFQVSVADELGIARVEWWLDDTRMGERMQAPFTQLWTTSQGEHTLFIRAFDLAGNMTQSAAVTFSVGP
jgi:membrane peptidoglycan carboxypeptidase